MANKLKAAVIGCGGGGMVNHIPWYAMNHDVELVGLVDPNPAIKEWVGTYGGTFYTNLDEMLTREMPDLVSIASPVHLHCEQTLKCLDHGCHVLCEKPMAPTLAECRKMIDHAAEKKRLLGIALDKRFSQVFHEMKRRLVAGEIGRPLFFRVLVDISQFWVPDPKCDPGFRGKLYTGGGAFQDLGSHYLDQISWILDSELTAINGKIGICLPKQMEVEDQAVATVRLANGLWGMLETTWVGAHDRSFAHHEELSIYGSDRVIRAFGAHRMELPSLELYDRKAGSWQTFPIGSDLGRFSHYQYKRMVDEFVACVKEGRPFHPDGTIGIKTTGAVLGLYQASHTGKEVLLPLEKDPPIKQIFEELRKRS
jgi:UDP-N-acetylglucosamine 3-dehydrogenase